MIILIHVLIALTSIIIASVTFFKPTLNKLKVSYGFILGTVASGTYLLVTIPSQILHTCITGLTYLTVITLVTIAAHVRLRHRQLADVTQENEN